MVTAPAEVNAEFADGKLQVSLTESAVYGKTYKVTVRAYEGAPAVTLSVAVLKQTAKPGVTIKASGYLDVIREGKTITITPKFTNVYEKDIDSMELKFYRQDGKNWSEVPKDDLFRVTKVDGKWVITADENLSHADKYKVSLAAVVDGKPIESKLISLSVKMGSAKLTLSASENILFHMDSRDRVIFGITSTDKTLKEAVEVEIKDKAYKNLFRIYEYGNGQFAVGYADAMGAAKYAGKTITLKLNVYLDGNKVPGKVNTTVKLKVAIVKK